MKILRLEDVKYKYNNSNKYLLNDVNIEFENGKIYTIIGKRGAGKSTLLAIIVGLDSCTEGKVFYKDQDLKNIDKDIYIANNVGIIFSQHNLLEGSRAVDNIILAISVSNRKDKNKRKIAYETLEEVGINNIKANTSISKLSDEEKYRVSIARAMVNNPDIIILDEPVINLHEESQNDISKMLLRKSKEEGKTIIIMSSTYKFSLHADEIWGLVGGKLMFVKSSID